MAADARNPVLAAFGRAVRELRTDQNLSQESLADAVGIHRTYIGSVERGERNVGLLNIIRIADALGVPASTLLSLAESGRPPNESAASR